MGGDYTRLTFRPHRDYSGVRMQQGRVQLDADWNEQVDIVDRRLRAETMDLVGRAVVPSETPDGFRVSIEDRGPLVIGPGRLYLDGLLVENHGTGAFRYDPHLGEVGHGGPLPYTDQLCDLGIGITPLGDRSSGLVYLEAWEREVSAVQDPHLVEPAVGVDTATRLQVAWRVRFHPTDGGTPQPGQVLGSPAWQHLVRPPDWRLSTSGSGPYTGGENRLYRVEVHDGADDGRGVTVKWSTVNGSAVYPVECISGDNLQITVRGAPRGASFPFRRGDWAELLDDRFELQGEPGVMVRVAEVDASSGAVFLETPASGNVTFEPGERRFHTRLRRWDQRGPLVNDGGVVPVSAGGDPIPLGGGVEIQFETAGGGGRGPCTGDYWVFTARSGSETVEVLRAAPPRGVLRHRCPLAIVDDYPMHVHDVRTIWYPRAEAAGRHHAAGCSIAVDADGHDGRRLTVQGAVDRVRRHGGSVCLGAGVYWLDAPLSLREARSVRLSGAGPATVLVHCGEGAAVAVEGSRAVTIENLSIVALGARGGAPPALRELLVAGLPASRDEAWEELSRRTADHRHAHVTAVAVDDSHHVRVARCDLYQLAVRDSVGPAVSLRGRVGGIDVLDSAIFGEVGIGSAHDGGRSGPEIAGLRVERNELTCARAGILVDERSIHTAAATIRENVVRHCDEVGIAVRAFLHPGRDGEADRGRLVVEANRLQVRGTGIAVTADRARVAANDVTQPAHGARGDGIHVGVGPASEVEVVDNSVRGASRALRVGRLDRPQWERFVELWRRLSPRQDDHPDRPLRRLSVHGNVLEAHGPTHAVEVDVDGPCIFAANQCVAHGAIGHGAIVVSLRAAGAVVSGNYVVGPPGRPPMRVDCGEDGPACVQGNVMSGAVEGPNAGCPPQ